ncbi:hypothetical protein DM01DRAFT_1233592 [Hesseltinella vesiculosa]|uniref:Nucleoporin Nup133/Nup155-like N-terminal domain-containing protein n=1 Tax=Hesseltinella vesiculosa TaxID=101127 RepID=A0A1X2GLR3_9FUNG|nr:hypothetical protein DM01DRAFT_1233592 [Hesseltinella vesiculosa]
MFIDENVQILKQKISFQQYLRGASVDEYVLAEDTCSTFFNCDNFVSLPDVIDRSLSGRPHANIKFGLLPEIRHAWKAVDSVVYFWNYKTNDIFQLESLNDGIGSIITTPGTDRKLM